MSHGTVSWRTWARHLRRSQQCPEAPTCALAHSLCSHWFFSLFSSTPSDCCPHFASSTSTRRRRRRRGSVAAGQGRAESGRKEGRMCIAFWLLDAHPEYKLLLALNRDEIHSRPTLPVHRWTDQPHIIGGRDGKEGGTWLAISESGRVAFVTNFREPGREQPGAVSRGQLPTLFLESSKSPIEYLEEVAARAGDYNGFNLVVADTNTGEMACLSNRPLGQPIEVKQVSPGLHCLSNANLDSPWPKVLRGKKKIEALLSQYPGQVIPEGRLIDEVLTDSTRAPVSSLPKTGLSEEGEHILSPIFVYRENPPYGTRSMAVIAVHKTGQTTFYEKYLEDGVWKDHKLSFFPPASEN